MIFQPEEIRYFHNDKTILLRYDNKKLGTIVVPLSYFYQYCSRKNIRSKQYVVAINSEDKGIRILFSLEEEFILSWQQLEELANDFVKRMVDYDERQSNK
ncbi:MAG: hypothetical protein HRT87_07975 [Legionellales bacterium]|nr:hypothetical protein [Legionellales bacterium]